MAETPLIGRDREVQDLVMMLAQPHIHLVTLVGPSGVGKSRLAVSVAEAVLEQFHDGVWLVNLPESFAPETVFQSIARVLGMAVRWDLSLTEQVLAHLEGRSVLLVLDSAGSTDSLTVAVRQLLTVATLTVLLTHTRPLHLRAEHLYEVKPLAVPPAREGLTPQQIAQYPAVQLLLERVRHYKSGYRLTAENAHALAMLCRHLDGLPLGIELAAPRLAVMAPTEVLKRLDERFHILQSRNPDLPDRQRTLMGAIEWSYSQLSESAHRLLRQLGLFAGGFTLEDAETICEADFLLDDLLELRQHAMLIEEHHKDRQQFRLMTPLRLFAWGRLREEPELFQQVSQRYAHYFLQMAVQASHQIRTSNEIEALQTAESRLEDFHQTLMILQQHSEWESCVLLGTALIRLLTRVGLLYSAQQYCEYTQSCLAQIAVPSEDFLAGWLLEYAGLLYEKRNWEQTLQIAQQALQRYESLGRQTEQALAHNLIGLAALGARDYPTATYHFEQALHGFEATHRPVWQAAVRNNLGLVAYETENYDRAYELVSQAVEQQCQHGDLRGLAEGLTNLGAVYFAKGDYASALRHFSDSLRYKMELGNRLGIARGLCNVGETQMRTEPNSMRAACYLVAAECLFRQVGSPDVRYVQTLLQQTGLDEPTLDSLRAQATRYPCEGLIQWAQDELTKPNT